jgi:hypothetical protein
MWFNPRGKRGGRGSHVGQGPSFFGGWQGTTKIGTGKMFLGETRTGC